MIEPKCRKCGTTVIGAVAFSMIQAYGAKITGAPHINCPDGTEHDFSASPEATRADLEG